MFARTFFKLVREHSHLKRASQSAKQRSQANKTRQYCHRHFWQFAKQLLDDNSTSQIPPQFSGNEAFSFFKEVYHADAQDFSQPEWMPSPLPPEEEFWCEDITAGEIQAAVKRMKSSSSPSPFDRITYLIFKRCPSLSKALCDLFNSCWTLSAVPSQWKVAAIKLIGKSSAGDDPTTPGNFRPIALTPCIGKLFTTILRNRWLSYMINNHYLDSSIQKAFMPTTPGCVEHHLKLAAILAEAKKKHKSLAVCWLDLANAYGSVHHSLIQFTLKHYHAPPQFCQVLEALYSELSAQVITTDWATPLIPLQIGVYQGDPLSVVIFNTVMNTLVDTLQTRLDLGYTISGSTHQINLLQYADDTCLLANSPASCQYLLNIVDEWLQWSGMQAKVPKCHSMALQGSTGRPIDPKLHLAGDTIPYAANGPVKFLGMQIHIPHDAANVKENLVNRLKQMLDRVDPCPVTRHQKLRLYKAGICPRLSWLLTIEELPITWVERQLEVMATRYLKKWAGLAKSANTALLYLPQKKGGMNLPSLTSLYKRLQVSRQSQLLMSRDPCVRYLAEKGLQHDLTLSRKKFKASVVVRNALAEDPNRNRKSLVSAAKRATQQAEDVRRETELKSLEKQGQMMRIASPDGACLWSKAVQSLPAEQMRFALNAAVDTLPHNANLHLWKKKESDCCPLCRERQTLIHTLNNCEVALGQRRYNERHDEVLRSIANAVKKKLPTTTNFTADLETTYCFPLHIAATDLRPDMVWWDDSQKQLWLAELTVCFETSFEEARERKETKYSELVAAIEQAGYNTSLITLEVGSRGVPHLPGFTTLAHELAISQRDLSSLLHQCCQAAITGSYKIWCARNRLNL